jgi:catechol 2,3-dioxygenase-like lactoylglutathione lyase family enzyme
MLFSKEIIQLRVDDALRAAVFYEALLDAPPTLRSALSAVFDLDTPPLVLTLEERPRARRANTRRESASRPGAFGHDAPIESRTGARLALVLGEPKQIGDVAIRLRRAGVRLWIQDEGLEAHDPDGNAWRVQCVPAVLGRAVVTALADPCRARRR